MNSPNLEARTQILEKVRGPMPESPALRLLGLVPILGLALAGGITYKTIIPPKDQQAERAFTAKYGNVSGGPVDVNKDGQYEYGISFRNIKGELEQWVYDTDNGQRVLKRVAEVKDGKIIYDRAIYLDLVKQ